MVKATIKWQRIAASAELQRSSQTIGVTSGILGIFGGELKPREPVDNRVYHVPLSGDAKTYAVEAGNDGPAPRVGAASTTLAGTAYVFSGRGGLAMGPLDEEGSLWAYSNGSWERITPADPSKPVPPPRSYHTMTNDGRDALFLHAGCLAEGRLNDLWAFVLGSKRWTKLADAPGNPRGGTSVTFCNNEDTLFRMGGFDGKAEIGGSVEVYDPVNDHWNSKTFNANSEEGPEARSVGCLVTLKPSGGDKSYLVTAFGERDPSSLGHAGAGKMLSDAWAYDIKDDVWTKIEQLGDEKPQPRGWFAADVLGNDAIVVQGGLAEDNSRIGDVWVGKFEIA